MNIKPEQRKRVLSIAPLLIATVILTSFLVWQMKVSVSTKEELAAKKKEFRHAEAASKHLRDLEKQISDIKQKEEMLFKKVPVSEKEPLGLIRTLISLGGQAGLKGVTVSLKEKSAKQQAAPRQRRGAADQGSQGGSEEAPAEQAVAIPVQETGEEGSAAAAQGPSPVYLQMEFEASFPRVLSFLHKLMDLERIVKVEGISVKRDKDILPYQKVSLDLVTYTF